MNLNLEGKHAVVCGSTQGIGHAAALVLASMGASVTLIARNRTKLEEVKNQLPVLVHAKHDFIEADFSNLDSVKKAASVLASREVHILVNNTGGPPSGPIVNAKEEEFLSAFSSHLICNHLLAQSVIPSMKNAGYGRIINIVWRKRNGENWRAIFK